MNATTQAKISGFKSSNYKSIEHATASAVQQRRHCVVSATVEAHGKRSLAVIDYYTPRDKHAPAGFYIALRLTGNTERRTPTMRAYLGMTLCGFSDFSQLLAIITEYAPNMMRDWNPAEATNRYVWRKILWGGRWN